MKITLDLKTKWNIEAVKSLTLSATREGLKDTIVEIANDVVKGSPFKFGNNRRSITYEVGPGGEIATEDLTAVVYSTSGYGGYLETGTSRMRARPYFRPAFDRNGPQLGLNIKRHM